jgi:hypothetical protein
MKTEEGWKKIAIKGFLIRVALILFLSTYEKI